MTHNKINVGDVFGRLTVLKIRNLNKKGRGFWHLCLCVCGNKKNIYDFSLKTGATKSCGCLQRESRKISRPKTHGMTGTPEREAWAQMKSRCINKKHKNYSRYGGRGIMFCNRWVKFENFYKDMGPRPNGFSLDRIDNNKGYYKDNCRWTTSKVQMRNTSFNRKITHNNQTKTVSEWAEIKGIVDATLRSRLSKWTIEKALETPVGYYHREKNPS